MHCSTFGVLYTVFCILHPVLFATVHCTVLSHIHCAHIVHILVVCFHTSYTLYCCIVTTAYSTDPLPARDKGWAKLCCTVTGGKTQNILGNYCGDVRWLCPRPLAVSTLSGCVHSLWLSPHRPRWPGLLELEVTLVMTTAAVFPLENGTLNLLYR